MRPHPLNPHGAVEDWVIDVSRFECSRVDLEQFAKHVRDIFKAVNHKGVTGQLRSLDYNREG